MQYLDDIGKSQGYIMLAHEKTGVRHAYIVITLAIAATFLLLNAFLNGFVLFIIGILMPAYHTFKAIESENKNDDTNMLCYWCVMSVLMILDRFLGFLLEILIFPGVVRFGILLALIVKKYAFSKYLYEKTIGPLLRKYDTQIEKATSMVTQAAVDPNKVREYAMGKITEAAVQQMTK